MAFASVRVFCEPVGSWKRADEWRELVLAGTLAAKSASLLLLTTPARAR